MNICIVGGGIVGCAAAYYLSKAGNDVTLLEKDDIASKASGFSFGGLLPPMVSDKDNLNLFTDFSIQVHKKLLVDLNINNQILLLNNQ